MEYDEYSNYTATWEEEDDYHIRYPVTLRNVLQGLATTVGLLGNVLLLVVLSTAPRLRTTPNVILLQRAVADTFSLTSMIFFLAAGTSGAIIITTGTCVTFSVIIHIGVVASSVLLMAFTLDSYQAAYPHHHSFSVRRKTMWVLSGLAWAMAAATGIAAGFVTYVYDEQCFLAPFFNSKKVLSKVIELFILFLVPLTVSWVLVSVALPLRPASSTTEGGAVAEKGPNRRLLLSLVSIFTVLHGLYWIFSIVEYIAHSQYFYFVHAIAMLLPTFGEALNPILVICLSEELRQVVAGWLPFRRSSSSLPLQDL